VTDVTMILGVDPGSRVTGFGLVRAEAGRLRYVASGCIRLDGNSAMPLRLRQIFEDMSEIIEAHAPVEMAVEQVFMAKSAGSALKLGQARGVAIVAAARRGIPVFEYSATRIKQSVVGTGRADKTQVQHMVRALLALPAAPQADAADALAVALCHAHTRESLRSMPGARATRRGRLR
jgi:crossover junction endodeoxyribonuclease RuvC